VYKSTFCCSANVLCMTNTISVCARKLGYAAVGWGWCDCDSYARAFVSVHDAWALLLQDTAHERQVPSPATCECTFESNESNCQSTYESQSKLES
jgi:hypothetical protein